MAEIVKETNNPLNKTRIMYKCNLSYYQLQVYLKGMLEMELLERINDNDSRERFVATSKGKDFAEQFHLLQAQMQ